MLAALVLFATALTGCEEKKQTPPPVAEAPAPRPRLPLGSTCASNQDCGDGLGCAEDKTCQSFKTIECRAREDACKGEGRCTGSDQQGCVAGSNADCQKAKVCQDDGRCTAQEGKCAATSPEDCKNLCTMDGRCSLREGKCAAASNTDCKDSEACKQYDRCIAKKGACVKR
jgi:hypothetical protein